MSFVKERLRFFVLTGQVACGLFDQLAVKYSNRVKVNSKNKKKRRKHHAPIFSFKMAELKVD